MKATQQNLDKLLKDYEEICERLDRLYDMYHEEVPIDPIYDENFTIEEDIRSTAKQANRAYKAFNKMRYVLIKANREEKRQQEEARLNKK